MSDTTERYIGLIGTGNETELEIVRETDRAYLLLTEDGLQIWMPKSCFEDDGTLKRSAYRIFDENLSKAREA